MILLGCAVTLAFTAAPARLVVAIGNDVGHAVDRPLQFAEADARRVADVFVELGAVAPADAVLLLGQPADAVIAQLALVERRLRALAEQGRDTLLVVYVSAHGAGGALHLGRSTLELERLRQAVHQLPATLRLLVVDACSSGATLRQKGGARALPVDVTQVPVQGMVVLSSSGPAEAAQEWDSLASSLFTHHLVAALRGRADADRDGRISLGEAYGYARRETVAAADQHPGFDHDVFGQGDVVLTEPRRARTAVELAPSLEGQLVFVGESPSSLIVELKKSAGEPLHLALPPARYRVRLIRGQVHRSAVLELGWGGLQTLGPADFSDTSFPTFALKGTSPRSVRLLVEVGTVSSGAAVTTPAPAVGLVGRWGFGPVFIAAGLGMSFGAAERATLRLDEPIVNVSVAGGGQLEVGVLRLALGLVARPLLVWQFARRTDADAARLFGVAEREARIGLGLETGAQLTVELVLPARISVGVVGEGVMRGVPSAGAQSLAPSLRIGVLAGLSLD